MSTLSIVDLGMRYGPQVLFEAVSLELTRGKRYGLVGANGTGKSTFLKIAAGVEKSTAGNIDTPKDASIGWLQQDHFQYEHMPVIHVVIRGKARLWQALEEKQSLLEKDNFTDEDGLRLTHLEEIIAQEGGYQAEAVAHQLLSGLGIAEHYHPGPLSALSGGFKLRVLLAQVLFQQPDILLLDEPTNHLDIVSIRWLSHFLQNDYRGLLLLISHDRDFINRVSTDILDVDYHTITLYPGNYDYFVAEKALASEQRAVSRKAQEKQIAHMQVFVDRFRAKSSKARQAQSRLKQISKIQVTEIQQTSRVAPHFSFNIVRPSGKKALVVKGISKSFGDNIVLDNVSFEVNRGEKVAIIGANGLGKSTLIKILLGHINANSGDFEWGYETHFAYFAQDHHEMLQDKQTVFDWLLHNVTKQTSAAIRKTLGRVLFSGDEANKSILSLSGGEAARLLLARIMLEKHNVLLLDEPTNHLDIEGIEALAKALVTYPGTLLFVSHDEYFVAHIANRIIALTHTGVRDFHGNYREYLAYYHEDDEDDSNLRVTTKKKAAQAIAMSERQKKTQVIDKINAQIQQLEAQVQAIDAQFVQDGFYQNTPDEDIQRLQDKRAQLQQAIDEKLKEWERLE